MPLRIRIFTVGGDRDFKFDRQVDGRKSSPMDDKSSLKSTWSVHMTRLIFLDPIRCLRNGWS